MIALDQHLTSGEEFIEFTEYHLNSNDFTYGKQAKPEIDKGKITFDSEVSAIEIKN